MRIAAGVLLIIAAVINLFASLGYLGGGAATSGLSNLSETVIESSLMEANSSLTAEEAAQAAKASGNMGGAGGMLMAMGVFLLASVGVLIAGAVFLFQSIQPKFALAAGVMSIVAEALGMALTSFGVMNLIGLVAGVLAIIAARSYMSHSPEPVAA
jgi:hypothetical protein